MVYVKSIHILFFIYENGVVTLIMNYLIFSAQFLPHMGGVENFTYNISKKLIECGHQVTVVTSNTTDSQSIENFEGIHVYRLDCHNLLNGRFPVYKKNKIFKDIMNTLDQQQFDFCVINTRFYFHSILGAKYAHKHKIPSIVIDHGTSHLTVHNKFFDFVGEKFEHFLTWKIKHYCQNYYGVSKASSKWLEHFNIESQGEIYNAIDLDKINVIRKHCDKSKFRSVLSIPEDSIIVSYTGRLIKEKGIVQLVHSIQKWNKEAEKPIYLCLAGDGPLLSFIKDIDSEYIIALGRLSFDRIVDLLNASDIFALPSDSEGFSTSLLEAAACKVYIFTTNRGGAKELLPDESYGTVIEENTEDEVYKGLNEALHNFNKGNAKDKTYERLADNFTWNISAERILKVSRNLE